MSSYDINKIKIWKSLIGEYFGKNFPDVELAIKYPVGEEEYLKILINKKRTCTILPNASWVEIKRIITTCINNTDELLICQICDINLLIMHRCPKCQYQYCYSCMTNIVKTNNSRIICPQCRDTSGSYTPDNEMDNFMIKWNSYLENSF
jgi:hypothetical protein